jgi:hypothetical protein
VSVEDALKIGRPERNGQEESFGSQSESSEHNKLQWLVTLFKEENVIEAQVADSHMMEDMKELEPVLVLSATLVPENHAVFATLSKEVNATVVILAVSHMKMTHTVEVLVALVVVPVLAMLSKRVSAHVAMLADLLMKCQLRMVLLNHVVFAMLSKTVNVTVDQPADLATRMVVLPPPQEVEEEVFVTLSKEVNVIVVTVVASVMNLLIPTSPVVPEVFATLFREVNVIVVMRADFVMKLPLLLKHINCAHCLSGTLGHAAQFVI